MLLDPHQTPETQEKFLGIAPTPENAEKVVDKLKSFGRLGPKGFDMAIATFAILRADEDHEAMAALINDDIEMFSRPFNFIIPNEGDDHGLLNGYTYGLHILPRHMADVRLSTYEANATVAAIAENTASGRSLLAQRTTDSCQPAFENGYFGAHPSNAESVISYLVLPTIDAIEIVDKSRTASLA